METNLTSKNVLDTFMFCLFDKGEDTTKNVLAEGIKLTANFHPERLKKKEKLIVDMLNELPDTFRTRGDSFLNICEHIKGYHWCELHQVMEQFLLLGLAIGKIEYLQSRNCWVNFEGGMPYIFVKQ